jgi:hypothetical protein
MAPATLVFNEIASNHDGVLNFHYQIFLERKKFSV